MGTHHAEVWVVPWVLPASMDLLPMLGSHQAQTGQGSPHSTATAFTFVPRVEHAALARVSDT